MITPPIPAAPPPLTAPNLLPLPGLPPVTPGVSTSEFKIASGVVSVGTLLVGLFIYLTTNGAIHLTGGLEPLALALPGAWTIVVGWITTNYINNRSDLKAAALAAVAPASAAAPALIPGLGPIASAILAGSAPVPAAPTLVPALPGPSTG